MQKYNYKKTEPSNFYSLPLIKAEEDMQSGKFEVFPIPLKVPRLLLNDCTSEYDNQAGSHLHDLSLTPAARQTPPAKKTNYTYPYTQE